MRLPSLVGHVKLTQYAPYPEREVEMTTCPWCKNARVSKSPRRKGGPAMFQCKKCGYIVSNDMITHAHWMLGQRAV